MVKRYVANSDCLEGVMQEYGDGPFVRYSDYAQLEAQLQSAEQALAAAKAESAIAAEPPCCGNCAKRHSEICVDTVNDYDDPCDEYERRPQ